MKTLAIENIIRTMIEREQKVTMTKIQLIELWLHQGLDIMALLEDHDANVRKIALVVGISKTTAYGYLTIAKDERINKLFCPTADTEKRIQLEPFNQNQIMKLIALDNFDFEEALRAGKLPTNDKDDEELPEVPLIEIIKHKRDLIAKIEDEIKELEEELSTGTETEDLETIEAEIIPPQIEPTKATEELYQSDIELVLRAITKAGNGVQLAKAINATKGAVTNWKNGNKNLSDDYRTLIIEFLEEGV